MDNEETEVEHNPECGHEITADTCGRDCPSCDRCFDCCDGYESEYTCEYCDEVRTPCRSHYKQCEDCSLCSLCHSRTDWECNNCGGSYCGTNSLDYRICSECMVCSDCDCTCRDTSGIRDYSTNVVYALGADIPDGVRTYGIELEFEAKNGECLEDLVSDINSDPYLNKRFICKSDGSLSKDGVEVVSTPMQLEDLKDAVTALFEKANITRRVSSSSRCGTHIHVGRDNVAPRTIARAWAPWAFSGKATDRYGDSSRGVKQKTDERMPTVLKALAGRSSNPYAAWSCDSPVLLGKVNLRYGGNRVRISGHYSAISTSSQHPTYEWRMFSGCTRVETALRHIETVDCLLSIAEETDGLKVCFDSRVLLEEIGKRIDRYPALKDTFANPKKNLSVFFDEIEAARRGRPRKLRTPAQRNGIEVPISVGARYGGEVVKKSTLQVGLKYLDTLATKPPKGTYIKPERPAIPEGLPEWPGFDDFSPTVIAESEQLFIRNHGRTVWVAGHSGPRHYIEGRYCVCWRMRTEQMRQINREMPVAYTNVPEPPTTGEFAEAF